jgi:uncharacterized protein (TIGR00106 family)
MLAELRLTPVDADVSFARLVADLVPILAASPLQYRVHAMGTTLEGGLDDILEIVRRCHEESRRHADRVLLELFLDDRSAAEGEIVRSVEQVRELQSEPIERVSGGAEPARQVR